MLNIVGVIRYDLTLKDKTIKRAQLIPKGRSESILTLPLMGSGLQSRVLCSEDEGTVKKQLRSSVTFEPQWNINNVAQPKC